VPKIEETELTKLYYSIGEVAEMFEVNTSLIRFWEKEFPAVKPKKNKKGNRLFSPREIMKLKRIYDLVKEQGYTLEGAKKAMRSKEVPQTESVQQVDNEVTILRLELLKERLLRMKH
jgi:DNA-binding transcriptional MerR regulator